MEVQLFLFLTNMHMLYELFVNELGMDWFLKQKKHFGSSQSPTYWILQKNDASDITAEKTDVGELIIILTDITKICLFKI